MQIDTVLFDMGGTLEDIHYSDRVPEIIEGKMEEILGVAYGKIFPLGGGEFYSYLQKRYGEYRSFREKTCIEVHPAMVWNDWIFKDLSIPAELIFDNHEKLAYFWETEVIVRECRKEAPEMLAELKSRGIRMGIISNTGSFTQVHRSLEKYGMSHYFEKIGLSSDYGIRKPHGFLFRDMLGRMQSSAEKTLYVGDTISRDVAGARNAGLFGSIQICSEFTKLSDGEGRGEYEPTYRIYNLSDIPKIVDEINHIN